MDEYLESHLRSCIKDLEAERDGLRGELKEFARFVLEKKKVIEDLEAERDRYKKALEA